MNILDNINFYNKLIDGGILINFGAPLLHDSWIYDSKCCDKLYKHLNKIPAYQHNLLLYGKILLIREFLQNFRVKIGANYEFINIYVLREPKKFISEYPFFMKPTLYQNYANQILPQVLWISNWNVAHNREFIENMSITHIIDLSGCKHNEFSQITYLNINIIDESFSNIAQYFETTNKFITESRICLVHCSAGVSRSTTIIIAYLMAVKKMSLRNAFILVKTARYIIMPNYGFLKQLCEYEYGLFGVNSATPIDIFTGRL
jgi:hypothetical protein